MADMNQENRKTAEEETNDSSKKEELEGDASENKEKSHKYLEIDIENLIIRNQKYGYPSSHICCIYRAHVLRNVYPAAFTPKIVSIGPLHHSLKKLKVMEDTKIRYLEQFLQHAANTARLHRQQHQLSNFKEKMAFLGWKRNGTQKTNGFSRLGEFRSHLESSEKDIRSSYAKNLNHIGSQDFFRLVLVDANFIIELFFRFHFLDRQVTPLPLYIFLIIKRDLWPLENQLSFFILEKLYDLAFGSDPQIYPPYLEFAFNFFQLYNEQKMEPDTVGGKVKHFTDLLRAFFLGNFEDEKKIRIKRKLLNYVNIYPVQPNYMLQV